MLVRGVFRAAAHARRARSGCGGDSPVRAAPHYGAGVSAPLFAGVGVALLTMFDRDANVDPAATAEHARRLVGHDIRGVVVAGTTGEAAALAPSERAELLETVRSVVPADVPVIAGTGAPSIRTTVGYTHQACQHGADALLVLSPPGVADPRPYYRAGAEAADDIPVVGYHFPGVSSPGIPVEVLADLPIAALKDSTGDADRLLDELVTWGGPLYVGSSALLSLAGPIGCRGAILGLANLEPELCVRAFAGDVDAQQELAPHHLAVRDAFPRKLKELVAERFGTSPVARLP